MKTNRAITTLHQEMDWLQNVIQQAICTYFLQEGHEKNWSDIPLPDHSESDSPYANAVKTWDLNVYSRLALALAMAPHIRPEALDIFFGKNQIYDRGFTEFGGVIDKNHSGFLPTGQTLCFLFCMSNPEMRSDVLNVLGKNSILIKEQVIRLIDTEEHVPRLNGILSLNDYWFHYFLTGEHIHIENSASFPAKKITTNMDWEDIVLDNLVMKQVTEINTWLKHSSTLMHDWGLLKTIKPGYRALFYGPPGTGKTLIATLIGKTSGRELYKVDLSLIVSDYIGETEKDLSKVFDLAEHKNWILFFDGANVLFEKSANVNSLND